MNIQPHPSVFTGPLPLPPLSLQDVMISSPSPPSPLQDVMISSPGIPDAQFIANRWLATDEGDKQCFAILYPFGTNGAAKEMHKYRIHVGVDIG